MAELLCGTIPGICRTVAGWRHPINAALGAVPAEFRPSSEKILRRPLDGSRLRTK